MHFLGFPEFFTKENNFCDFLFAFQKDNSFLKKDLLLKERFRSKQRLSFKLGPINKGDKNGVTCTYLESVPIQL